jgi:hypothetical protein
MAGFEFETPVFSLLTSGPLSVKNRIVASNIIQTVRIFFKVYPAVTQVKYKFSGLLYLLPAPSKLIFSSGEFDMESAKVRVPVHNLYYTGADKTNSSVSLKDSYYNQYPFWTFYDNFGRK